MKKNTILISFIISLLTFSTLNIFIKETTGFTSMTNEEEVINIEIIYDGEGFVPVNNYLLMEVFMDYDGSTYINLNITFYLEYKDNGSIIMLHSNSSVYLDQSDNNYYNFTSLLFKSCDKGFWDLWAIAENKDTGYEYIDKTTFEVIPFEFFLHQTVYYTYVGEPTWFAVEILYYESVEKYINIEVLIDDSSVNNSIYNEENIYFPGNSPPETFWLDFYYKFGEMDDYTVWLVVQDQSTLKNWIINCNFEALWFEIEITYELQLFVGNLTTIEFNISSSINYPMYVDLSVYIYKSWPDYWWIPNVDYNETVFEKNNLLLDGSFSKDNFYSNVSLSFDEKGTYKLFFVVKNINGIYQEKNHDFFVSETINLEIQNEYYTWIGDTENFYIKIKYYETCVSLVTIKLFLDDGTYNITLFSQENFEFDAQMGDIFSWAALSSNVQYTFTKKGYYDIHLLCTIQATGEVLYQPSWILVKDIDIDPPVFIEINGLEDGGTYSGEIVVTTNITDQSYFYPHYLQINNENDSETFGYYLEEIKYNVSHYLFYIKFVIDSNVLYDGDYDVIFEAVDDEGNTAIKTLKIKLENDNIYVPTTPVTTTTIPDVTTEENTRKTTDTGANKITTGFEFILAILVLLPMFLILKWRK